MLFSSIVCEVIKAILNFFIYFIFFTRRFHTHKKHKTHTSEKKQKRQRFSNSCSSKNIATLIRSLFHGDWCSEIHWKKVRCGNWMAANFNVRKMYSRVKRMDGCEYYLKNIVFLKKRIASANFFLEIYYCWKKYWNSWWLTTCSPVKIKKVPLKT